MTLGSCRAFSTSAIRRVAVKSHYEILQIPQNASKSQIKSSYYQLSKRYHPDLNKDPAQNALYPELRAAYEVLSDDRKRRQYDRSLLTGSGSFSSSSSTSSHMHAHHHHSTRRRPAGSGATYAWQRYPYTRRPHPNHQARPHVDPFAYTPFDESKGHNPNRRKSTAQKYAEQEQAAMDRVRAASGFWRNVVLVGTGVLVYSLVGSGATA